MFSDVTDLYEWFVLSSPSKRYYLGENIPRTTYLGPDTTPVLGLQPGRLLGADPAPSGFPWPGEGKDYFRRFFRIRTPPDAWFQINENTFFGPVFDWQQHTIEIKTGFVP